MHRFAIWSKITILQTQNCLRALVSFSNCIAGIVEELPYNKTFPRHERNLRQILHIATSPSKGKLVKIAKKLDNFTDLLQGTLIRLLRVAECLKCAEKVTQALCGTNSALETQLETLLSNCQTAQCVDLLKDGCDKALGVRATTEMLIVQKRRMYDSTNVLECIELINKNCKDEIRSRRRLDASMHPNVRWQYSRPTLNI